MTRNERRVKDALERYGLSPTFRYGRRHIIVYVGKLMIGSFNNNRSDFNGCIAAIKQRIKRLQNG